MSTTSFGITFNLSAHVMDPNLPGIVGMEFITKAGLGFLDVAFFVIALSLLLVFLWLIILITRWSIQGSRNIELQSISVGNSPREFSSLEDIRLSHIGTQRMLFFLTREIAPYV
ncbi:hypothetical protein Sjap_004402 [Stephania japonica]|uniref:Uncharacterized protein n=1 Tax=Stephania japonica TaxID=461633 RepID=A0AAP0K3H2_9MAGN